MIDVIIPTYNRAATLERAIESVLKQSFTYYKLIVVDDGSTDATPNVLSKYLGQNKITILRQDNHGVSSARNLGIQNSSAEWVAFLDSDDEWLPQKIEIQLQFIKQHPEFNFIHSNEIWMRNNIRVNAPERFDKSSKDLFRRSLEMCLISPSTVMMKREMFQKYGHFDEEFVVCEDYDLWLKILSQESVGFITEALIKKYGGHPDQLSTQYPAMDFWRIKSMINLLEKDLSSEQERWVCEEIQKKAPILLKGYLKHQNLKGHKRLTEMLDSLLRWKSKTGHP